MTNTHYINLIANIQYQLNKLKEEMEHDDKVKADEIMLEYNKDIAENGG